MSRNSESCENTCVVCFKNVDIYSIGACDHPVCYECSTRMRVLCRQNECPICRQDMPKVVFLNEIKSFTEVQSFTNLQDKKFKICFENVNIQQEYNKLLEHYCDVCSSRPAFRNFSNLKLHMRREHELHYCDLCTDNLKIFTSERKCYTRTQLAQHRRKGDDDNRSHRGHPLCEFCDQRYMDNDELFRHLRRDHLYCHFCDADGQHLYYNSYNDLVEHFRNEHYICEEGTCIDDKLTAVFRSEIDLKAHKALLHCRNMGKAAAKQARTLELEFTLKRRPGVYDYNKRGKQRGMGDSREEEGCSSQDEMTTTITTTVQTPNLTMEEFPSLSGKSATNNTNSSSATPLTNIQPGGLTIHAVGRRKKPLAVTDENFPALTTLTDSHYQTQSTCVKLNINQDKQQQQHAPQHPNLSIHVNRRPAANRRVRINNDDFPSLSSTSSTTTDKPTTWVSQASSQKTQQPPAPQQQQQQQQRQSTPPGLSSLSIDSDFPSLAPKLSTNINFRASEPPKSNFVNLKKASSGKKESSLTISVKQPAPCPQLPSNTQQQQQTDTNTKKNKKKKNKQEDTVKKKTDNPADDKKRSELSIEPNTSVVNGINNITINDKVKPPPPPGFSENNIGTSLLSSDVKPPPPPGFNVPNGLVFTNSSGQSYQIHTNYQYTPSADFHSRNQLLVTKVNQILLNSSNLEQFRMKSSMFRQNTLSAQEYIDHCAKCMGERGFNDLFPELLVLLPDIDKQQELYQVLVYSNNNKLTTGGRYKLETCDKCRQIVFNCDLKQHLQQHHLDINFPTLGK